MCFPRSPGETYLGLCTAPLRVNQAGSVCFLPILFFYFLFHSLFWVICISRYLFWFLHTFFPVSWPPLLASIFLAGPYFRFLSFSISCPFWHEGLHHILHAWSQSIRHTSSGFPPAWRRVFNGPALLLAPGTSVYSLMRRTQQRMKQLAEGCNTATQWDRTRNLWVFTLKSRDLTTRPRRLS